ncbi:oleate hydratase [Bradyrhizobium cenepequi]
MHYSRGNYEAFFRPRKPDGADRKSAWFVGSGLASLAGAAFLIRDGGVAGERITILEELDIPGGALDGLDIPEKGFVIRGGREMEEHFECLWDLYRSIPSLELEDASVLDEFYRLNKDDPNVSLQRVTQNQGQDVPDKALLTLNDKAQRNLLSEPPPNEWTPVVGSLSPEVSNGTSTSVVYRRVQAASRRAGVVERALGHVGCQGAWSARLGAAALGG